MSSATAILSWVGPGMALVGAAIGLVSWYVRDRRKSDAEAQLIESTTSADADLHATGAQDARLLYVQRQVDMERAFHVQQIADRDAEILRQRSELQRRDETIASLLRQVGHLQQQLEDMSIQLTSVRTQLTDLADHTPPFREKK